MSLTTACRTAVRLPVLPDLTPQGLIDAAEPGLGAVRVADHGAICWQRQVTEAAECSGSLSLDEIAITIGKAPARTPQPCCLA